MILPADWADEFAAFCAANPKPCPLIAQSAPGDPDLAGPRPRHRRAPRPAALSGVPRRRGRVGGDGYQRACGATTWSPLRSAAPIRSRRRCSKPACRSGTSSRARRSAPIAPGSTPCRPGACMAAWWCRCATSPCPMPFAPSRSPRAFRACTARRSTSAIRRDRHRRHRQARIRRRARHPAGRGAAVLGLRGHAAGGDRGGPAAVLHHPQGRPHAGHRPIERGVPRGLR